MITEMARLASVDCPSARRLAWLALAATSLAGCGRIGLDLLPKSLIEDGSLPSGADDADAGGAPPTSLREGGLETAPDAGSCESNCENPHGTAECVAQRCVTTCANGYADCDGNPANGCETSVMDTASQCGSCALTCENPHGERACAAGLCTPSCAAGFADCDGDASNGCESDLSAPTTCGACGVRCTNEHGSAVCDQGRCMPSCASGYADCDGDASNGCETNTASDPMHCGSCTNACGTNGQVCMAGMCRASTCQTGRGECDDNLTVTCETDLTTSVDHCGFCGNVCRANNGTPGCGSGSCNVARCNGGYGNCDNVASNGCEAQLSSSVAHCGACGAACSNAHGSTSCVASACAPSCSTGWGDCDQSRANGCETALDSVNHCGGCGRVCPANGGSPTCNGGVCGTDCNLSGTWALKVQLAVTWPDSQQIAGGNGSHTFWLRLVGTHDGNALATTVSDCGRSVPPFRSSSVNETFLFGYANTLFDETPPFMPTASATASLNGRSPGSSFSLPLTALLMGTSLPDPVNAAWPARASSLTRVDHDGDGKAGVTADYSNSNGYSYPRTGTSLFSDRALRAYTASRLVFSLNGSLNNCTRSTGPATVKFIDTRIYGCRKDDGSDCNASEADFLDRNCVPYNPGSASYTLVKVGSGATCADVKSALP